MIVDRNFDTVISLSKDYGIDQLDYSAPGTHQDLDPQRGCERLEGDPIQHCCTQKTVSAAPCPTEGRNSPCGYYGQETSHSSTPKLGSWSSGNSESDIIVIALWWESALSEGLPN